MSRPRRAVGNISKPRRAAGGRRGQANVARPPRTAAKPSTVSARAASAAIAWRRRIVAGLVSALRSPVRRVRARCGSKLRSP
ncbi:hypothetical protein GLA29479_3944 [Lysobacter antibioticus]|nr:hypothetical protein GLA29479_3944 [Lysobacter antibioticus]